MRFPASRRLDRACNADATEVAADWRIACRKSRSPTGWSCPMADVSVVIQHVEAGQRRGTVWVHLPKQNTLFMGDLATPNVHPLAAEADLASWLDVLRTGSRQGISQQAHRPRTGQSMQQGGLGPTAAYLRHDACARPAHYPLAQSPGPTWRCSSPEFLGRYPLGRRRSRLHTAAHTGAGLDHKFTMHSRVKVVRAPCFVLCASRP